MVAAAASMDAEKCECPMKGPPKRPMTPRELGETVDGSRANSSISGRGRACLSATKPRIAPTVSSVALGGKAEMARRDPKRRS
jgi:hypothetical protein